MNRPTASQVAAAQRAARDQLAELAHNRTPRGLPLDEWNRMQNAAKRERRARRAKGKR